MPAPPAATDVSRVHVNVRLGPDAAWIHVFGDIDVAAAPRLHSAIDEALDHGLPVWLDLSGVTFVDSACVHEVLHAQQLAFAKGTCLLIVPPTAAHVMRPFDLLELTARLPFVDPPPATSSRGHLRGLPSLYGSERRHDVRVADVAVEG